MDAKNNDTNRYYKKMVRIIKKMRYLKEATEHLTRITPLVCLRGPQSPWGEQVGAPHPEDSDEREISSSAWIMRQDYLVRSYMPHVSDDFMYIFGFKIINQIELVLESYCLVIE